MSHFTREQRPFTGRANLFNDVAYHLQARYHLGATVVVVRRPKVFVSVLMKAWVQAERMVWREMARTFKYRALFLKEAELMRTVNFVAAETAKAADAEKPVVIFVAPDTLAGVPALYATLYVIDAPSEERRLLLEERLMPHGVLVEYTYVAHPTAKWAGPPDWRTKGLGKRT
ncbi:hypothetical protein ACFY3G_18305 [Streptomyces phaeochromogenes]|uniref:hypothetical protein n=1 Tax=Streptomyces phaeochromogenes TaxID=1923 RepID=UPI0036C8D4A6